MITLAALLLTYFIHSSIFIALALMALRFKVIKPDVTGELLLKTVMVLGIVTTGIQYTTLNNQVNYSGFLQWQLQAHDNRTTTQINIHNAKNHKNKSIEHEPNQAELLSKINQIHAPIKINTEPDRINLINAEPIREASKNNLLTTPQQGIKLLITPIFFVVLWLCFSVYLLARKIDQWRIFKQLIQLRFSVSNTQIIALFDQLKLQAQLFHKVNLTECEFIDSPLVLNRNEVVLPLNFHQYMSSEHIKAALAHELAHIKRHDHLWLWFCTLIESLLFIQPLNRLISQQIYQIAEHRSDLMASQWTGNPYALAEALSKVAHKKYNHTSTQLVPTMTSKKTHLLSRIEHLLLSKRKNTTSLTLLFGLFITSMVLFGAPGFSINNVNAITQIDNINHENDNESSMHNIRTKYMDDKEGHYSINMTSIHNGKVLKLKANINEGLTFNKDETAIKSFTTGNKLSLMTKDDNIKRRIVIKSIDNQPHYNYQENGQDRPFDDNAQAWFSSKIPEILRTTGINAEQRVQSIHKEGGNDAVLDEIKLIRSDHNQAKYLEILFSMTPLSTHDFSKAIDIIAQIGSDFEQANTLSLLVKTQIDMTSDQWVETVNTTEKISSDFEQAKTLMSFTNHLPDNTQVNNAFAHAISKIGSDFELSRVIDHYIDKKQVSDETNLVSILKSAKSIGSDYELTTLLIKNHHIAENSPLLFTTLMKLSKSIGSDFELNRLYSQLLKLNLNSNQLSTLVTYARSSIGSDFELSNLLIEVISNKTMSDQHVELVKQAAKSIGSEHEKNRVLVQLIDKI